MREVMLTLLARADCEGSSLCFEISIKVLEFVSKSLKNIKKIVFLRVSFELSVVGDCGYVSAFLFRVRCLSYFCRYKRRR